MTHIIMFFFMILCVEIIVGDLMELSKLKIHFTFWEFFHNRFQLSALWNTYQQYLSSSEKAYHLLTDMYAK